MSKEKQIEEIRKDIFNAFGGYAKWEEDWQSLAEAIYNAGYRKQSENVIELPCKIGDVVYIIDDSEEDYGEPYVLGVRVLQFFINKNGIALDLQMPLGLRLNTWAAIGKNVFLTEAEAEKALAKMKGGAE